MSPEKQKEIAAAGGRAAHANGTAHQFTPEEAAAAGRKGGASHSSEHMKKIGSAGGKARGRRQREAAK
jgi:general stress protein YciG